MARPQENPAYLQSEEAFKSVASYEQRKSIVFWQEKKYWVQGRYTGETQQNEALIKYLKNNPEARTEWERVLGISRESLRWLKEGVEKKKGFKAFFSRLFGSKNTSDVDKTFVTTKTAPAEYGINTTLCAKTARNNAENIFGITDLPRGNAGDVLAKLSKTKPSISLDETRNTTGATQVAYVGIDVVDVKTQQKISHVALAVKPNGGKEWFITDPYQGGQGFIRLRDYPANISEAYQLSPQKDNLSSMRLNNTLKVVQYKQGLLGANERATNTPEVEYGQGIINENNLFYALGDRNFSGTMGDDLKRKRFLGLIPYGKKRSTEISDEYHIARELQIIADLPKTRVADFISQCIEAGGGNSYRFWGRQDVMRTLFTTINGRPVATQAHKQFLQGFDLLNKAGYIDQVKNTDKLGKIDDAKNSLPENAALENYIANRLDSIDPSSPLYDYVKSHKFGIADRLTKQVGLFLGKSGISLWIGVDLTKHIQIVAGIAGGKPWVGVMFHTGKSGDWWRINGSVGVWNGLPVIWGSVAKNLNRGSVANIDNLTDYTQSLYRVGVSGMASPAIIGATLDLERDKIWAMDIKTQTLIDALENGRFSELPPEIHRQLYSLYQLMGRKDYGKAMAAVVSLYKNKLIDANRGWGFKGVSIGGGIAFGLPTILGAIRFSYIEKNMIPDANQLKDFAIRAQTEWTDIGKAPESHIRWVGGINESIPKFGGDMPYTASSGIINGRNALRFTTRSNKMPLNVYAAPGFRENIRYQNGVIDVVQMTNKFPTIKTFVVHVGGETRHFLVVWGTNIQGASKIEDGHNESGFSGSMSNNTKTFNFDYYRTEDSIPNEPTAEEKEIAIWILLSIPPKSKPNPNPTQERTGSTPSGGTGEDPGGTGYNTNGTETHHQSTTNTSIQSGQYTPWIDGTPPASWRWVPTNTSTTL